jgi:hypothetical protein
MIWVAWRQHRAQLVAGSAVLALLLAFLLTTGVGIASAFRSSGLAGCLAVSGEHCDDLANAFTDRYSNLQFTVPLFLVLPALIGLFWGAPLVAKEVEQGTHRLVWTQGVTRLRWLGVKLAVLAGATAAGVAVVTWVLSWWSRPLVTAADNRLNPGPFDLRGIVPIAYGLFALALGVAAGTVLRRVVPAMAATVAAYVATRWAVAVWLRPHFAAAKTASFPFLHRITGFGQGDWILSTKTVDRSGRFMGTGGTLNINLLGQRCPALDSGRDSSRTRPPCGNASTASACTWWPGTSRGAGSGCSRGSRRGSSWRWPSGCWSQRRCGCAAASRDRRPVSRYGVSAARRPRPLTTRSTTMARGISDSRASHCATGSWMPTSFAVRP